MATRAGGAGRHVAGIVRPPAVRRPALLAWAWAAGLVLLLGVLVLARLVELPGRVPVAAAGGVVTLVGAGLAARSGGRPLVPLLLGAALTGVAVGTLWPVLLAGGTVAAAVLAGCFAVLVTRPAPRLRRVPGEVVLAVAVATLLGLGASGFGQPVHEARFGYLVLGGALVATFLLVHRLGAGLHGVGRRGFLSAGVGIVVLGGVLAYTAALSRWGSPGLIGTVDDMRQFLRLHLGAVPHPVETLVGVPALAWGVFIRARRRQGWWVCAFGAAATAPAATRFLEYGVPSGTTALGAAYSLLVGLVLAVVVILLDQVLSGNRGRRARRQEEATAHRPEPGRLEPLH